MVPPNAKKRFLETLNELPIISVACKRTQISKATVYRWKQKDQNFRDKLEEALDSGRENITDLAESKLIAAINKDQRWAIQTWLENNTKRYVKPRKPIDLGELFEKVEKRTIEIVQDHKFQTHEEAEEEKRKYREEIKRKAAENNSETKIKIV